MSNEETLTAAHEPTHAAAPAPASPSRRRRTSRLALTGVAGIALLALGVAGGAGAMKLAKPSIEMAPMAPVAISAMPDGDLVTIKGQVAEIFGNKFVLQDASGRALVETGPSGEDGKLVKIDEAVSVQGRFDDGFLHASFLVHPDGKVEALGPAGRPPHHEHGPKGLQGPKDGPKRGPGALSDAGPAGGPADAAALDGPAAGRAPPSGAAPEPDAGPGAAPADASTLQPPQP